MPRVALAYVIAAFVALEISDVLAPALGLPDWAIRLVAALAIAGFPLAVGLAWAFDRTPEGVVRTAPRGSEPPVGGGPGDRADRSPVSPDASGSSGGRAPEPAGGAPAAAARRAAAPDPTAGRGGRAEAAGPAGSVVAADDDGRSTGAPDVAGASAPRRPDRFAIAVLPFANLSDDRENEFFSDGVTEDILTNLSRTGRFRVISRTSVMVYKSTTKPLKEIARELDVGTVLEGTVRRAGGRVRIVAQLIDAATDDHLWADTYDRDLDDVFAVQSDVALQIARALEAELAPEAVARIERRPTAHFEAYDVSLRARRAAFALDPAAVPLFEEALRLDPDFAQAHAELAVTLMVGVYYAQLVPRDVFEAARSHVERALELDPTSAEAHSAAAWLALHYDWDWDRAVRECHTALELDPNDGYAIFLLAAEAVGRERPEEAVRWLDRGISSDPHNPGLQSHRAQYTLYAGRLAEAERLARDVVARFPDYFHGRFVLAYSIHEQGRYAEALTCWDRVIEISPRVPLWRVMRGAALHGLGREVEAREVFAEAERVAEREYVDPVVLAAGRLRLGDVEGALDFLERGLADRAFLMLWLRAIPRYRRLRAHPRFQRVLRTIWPHDEIEGVPPP